MKGYDIDDLMTLMTGRFKGKKGKKAYSPSSESTWILSVLIPPF